MDIWIVKTERISEGMERWWIHLPKASFRDFGFLLEALDGVGLHSRSLEAEEIIEVDVALGLKEEFLALLDDLENW